MTPAAAAASADAPPAHRVPLERGWSLWRSVWVRAAGFPAEDVLRLAAPDAARAVDKIFALRAEASRRKRRASELLRAHPAFAIGDPRLTAAANRLRRGALPDALGAPPSVADAIADAAAAEEALEAARLEAARLIARASCAADDEALAILRSPRFREAVLWQNRAALATRSASGDRRRRTSFVARYLQRYCAKNDTIGFMGPVAWAELTPDVEETVVRPGASLLARRTVYFEHWAIQALAARLAEDPELLPLLPPRRLPTARLEGGVLHLPIDRVVALPDAHARALALCDGGRSAREIARTLLAEGAPGLEAEEDVLGVLDDLRESGVISWTLEVPTTTQTPERHLRAAIERIEDAAPRERALEALSVLEERRAAVAGAAGDPDRLEPALRALDEGFREVAGGDASRRAGEIYAGRTVAYEDCLRDLDLSIGGRVLSRLGPPLALLLEISRWRTHRIARGYARVFADAHRRLSSGARAVSFLRFFEEAAPAFHGAPAVIAEAHEELQRRVRSLFALDGADRRVQRDPETLAPAVRELFAAPGPGWPRARHHSPDIVLGLPGGDPAAEPLLVLGEMHAGLNSLLSPLGMEQHPAPGGILAAAHADLGARVWAICSIAEAGRATDYALAPHDLELATGSARSRLPPDRVLEAGSLVVEEADGRLVVRRLSDGRRFHLMEVMEHYLMAATNPRLDLFPPLAHLPRVTLGDLVVQRESWRVTPEEIPFVRVHDEALRFVQMRRFARERGMPRFLFFRVPAEPKPVFLDLESPAYVNEFARLAREAPEVTLTEMLPRVEEAYLPDALGRRYTCELRIVAVDPAPWSPE